PHLLTVHDPLVAVAHRARRERGEVGTAAGLAEQLATLPLPGEDPREVTLFLVFAPEAEHRRRALTGADRVEHATVRRRARLLQAVGEQRLQLDRGAEPAVPGRVLDPREPGVVLRAEERDGLG